MQFRPQPHHLNEYQLLPQYQKSRKNLLQQHQLLRQVNFQQLLNLINHEIN